MAAQKRMFDRAIIETDQFLDLPDSGKALYFLLGMEADDEGFVSPKRVMRLYQIADDNLKILITKNFVIPFETGVVVITDWHKNNWLDTRRIKPTEYQKEKEKLLLTEQKEYVLSERLATASPEEYRREENRTEEYLVQNGVNAPTVQDISFATFWNLYPLKKGKKKASEKWEKLTAEEKHLALVDLADRPSKDRQWLQGFAPHATTYLNGALWEDDYETERVHRI